MELIIGLDSDGVAPFERNNQWGGKAPVAALGGTWECNNRFHVDAYCLSGLVQRDQAACAVLQRPRVLEYLLVPAS